MTGNERLPYRAVPLLVAAAILEVGFLRAPAGLVATAGSGAPAALLLGFALMLVPAFAIGGLLDMFGRTDLLTISGALLGRSLGDLVGLVYALFWLLRSAVIIRLVANLLSQFLLVNTPVWAIAAVIAAVTTYMAVHGIEPLARFTSVALPFYWATITLLLIWASARGQVELLLPWFDQGLQGVLAGALGIVTQIQGLELALVFAPVIVGGGGRGLGPGIALGVLAVLVPSLLAVAATLMVFGGLAPHLVWPTIDVVQVVFLLPATLLLERLDGAFLLLWLFAVVIVVAFNQWALTETVSRMLKIPYLPRRVLAGGGAVLAAALAFPSNVWVEEVAQPLMRSYTVLVVYAGPVMLYLLARVRGKAVIRGVR